MLCGKTGTVAGYQSPTVSNNTFSVFTREERRGVSNALTAK